MGYALSASVDQPYPDVVQATRDALAEQGFGVLSEIDLTATLRAKLGVELPQQVILGACRPPLAHAALQAEPSIGLLLPCNVVVREAGPGRSLVEAMDPRSMIELSGNEALRPIADEATQRLNAALATVQHGADAGRRPAGERQSA